MTKHSKFWLFLLSSTMGAGFSVTTAWSQTSFYKLQVYAGPQTVAPGQNVSVTIEMTDIHGESSNDETVKLIYTFDGKPTSLSGKVSQGLVSFDVPAQRRAGNMMFTAHVGDLISNQASLMVVAGAPIGFELTVESSRSVNHVDLTSDVIRDAFGNPISDQSLITLDWVDQSGLKKSEYVQLSNGRVSHMSACPNTYMAPLKVRAVLKNVDVISAELSDVCSEREE